MLQPADEDHEIKFEDQSAIEKLYLERSLLRDLNHKAMKNLKGEAGIEELHDEFG